MKRLLLLLSLALAGCLPTKMLNSWLGHDKAELYRSWGPPTRVTEDGAGGEILIYEEGVYTGQVPGQAYRNAYGGMSYTNPQATGYNRVRMFYVDKAGKIYMWKAKGV
jgi:hypothetical protein